MSNLIYFDKWLGKYLPHKGVPIKDVYEKLYRLEHGLEEEPRICDACGKEMTSGYVIGDGEEYYCSDECLYEYYSEEEYDELCQNGSAYWTEWECVR